MNSNTAAVCLASKFTVSVHCSKFPLSLAMSLPACLRSSPGTPTRLLARGDARRAFTLAVAPVSPSGEAPGPAAAGPVASAYGYTLRKCPSAQPQLSSVEIAPVAQPHFAKVPQCTTVLSNLKDTSPKSVLGSDIPQLSSVESAPVAQPHFAKVVPQRTVTCSQHLWLRLEKMPPLAPRSRVHHA